MSRGIVTGRHRPSRTKGHPQLSALTKLRHSPSPGQIPILTFRVPARNGHLITPYKQEAFKRPAESLDD